MLVSNLRVMCAGTVVALTALVAASGAQAMDASYPKVGRLCQQAGILAAKGQIEDAMALFSEAVETDENSPDAHSHLAVALAKQQRHPEALAHFRKAAELSPASPIFNANAARALEQAVRFAPDNASYYLRAAMLHQYRAVRFAPDNASYYLRAAMLLSSMGNDDNAAKYLRKYRTMAPGHVEPAHRLALLLEKLRRHDEAAETHRSVLALVVGAPAAARGRLERLRRDSEAALATRIPVLEAAQAATAAAAQQQQQ
jgi:tetratricopeptide (TPR) repeat protein